MKLIKIKIGSVYTKIWYKRGKFNSRVEAVQSAIYHLKRMLEEKDIDVSSS